MKIIIIYKNINVFVNIHLSLIILNSQFSIQVSFIKRKKKVRIAIIYETDLFE